MKLCLVALVLTVAGCSSTPPATSPEVDTACAKYARDNHLDLARACGGDAAVQGDAGAIGR